MMSIKCCFVHNIDDLIGEKKWRNGGMTDGMAVQQNGRMAERRNGRIAEWQNGRMAEWQNGGTADGMVEWWEWGEWREW
jgi:hypothetical protein